MRYNSIVDTVSTVPALKETAMLAGAPNSNAQEPKGAAMFKGTPELITQRREEIINACESLYRTMSFKAITLKEIGKVTSFSRPTIYNYFQTKEEIFLALYTREYDLWNEELTAILRENKSLTKEQLAHMLAASITERRQLLKLLSMNNYDMEAESRPELLVSFKTSYGRSLELFGSILNKFRPRMSSQDVQKFIYLFFPFMFGIYPYSSVTEKQRLAMKTAGVDFVEQTIYELTSNCLLKLL